MKKRILLVVAVLAMFSVFTTNAQVKFGVKAGLNLANINGDDFEDSDMKMGLAIGGFANFQLSDKIEFQPELLYSMQGAKQKDMYIDEGITADMTFKLDYINIPLMLKYKLTDAFSIQAGPQIGLLVSDKWKTDDADGDISDDMGVDLKGVDFGLNFGLGYTLENGFGIDARYNLGMSQILDMDEADSKNAVIQIAVSYAF